MAMIKTPLWVLCAMFLYGCATARPPLKTVESVDIQRFMGSWYVIACIPTLIETKAFNAVETYQLRPDGTIDTLFTFNKGDFNGPLKRYHPHGFVVDRVNYSTWGMQFLWPFKSEYLITSLSPDYRETVIGRSKRDYFWIMARTPEIPDADYTRLISELATQGYDVTKVRKVPQRWPGKP